MPVGNSILSKRLSGKEFRELKVGITEADLELVVVVVDFRVRLLVLVVGLRRVEVARTLLESNQVFIKKASLQAPTSFP